MAFAAASAIISSLRGKPVVNLIDATSLEPEADPHAIEVAKDMDLTTAIAAKAAKVSASIRRHSKRARKDQKTAARLSKIASNHTQITDSEPERPLHTPVTISRKSAIHRPISVTPYSHKLDALITYMRDLIGTPYTYWDGETWKADNTAPFWAIETPIPVIHSLDSLKYGGGINCAGLLNIALQFLAKTPPGVRTNYPGGTSMWGRDWFWEKYEATRVYPRGSILLRAYRDIRDQGHLAFITTDNNPVGINNYLIHATPILGGVVEAQIKVVHITDPRKPGYFEYVSTPAVWFTAS